MLEIIDDFERNRMSNGFEENRPELSNAPALSFVYCNPVVYCQACGLLLRRQKNYPVKTR